jgi:hypothetical protein
LKAKVEPLRRRSAVDSREEDRAVAGDQHQTIEGGKVVIHLKGISN